MLEDEEGTRLKKVLDSLLLTHSIEEHREKTQLAPGQLKMEKK